MAVSKAQDEKNQSMPVRSIRDLIELFDQNAELLHVKRTVHRDTELMAVLKRAQTELKRPVLFENVEGTDFRYAGNLYGGRDKLARIFNVREEEVVEEWIRRFHAERRKPVPVDRAPCQEVVYKGNVNVGEILPIPHQYRGDAAPFINSAIVVAKDPKTKTYNASFHRMQLREGNRLGIQLVINMDLFFIHKEAEQRGEPVEVAAVISPDPYFFLAAATRVAREVDEIEYAGALAGYPIEMVKCKSVDLKVPASAEIVIEGQILPNTYLEEGPMGEVLQYYGSTSPKPVFEVSAITHRQKPIMQTLLTGTIEDHTLCGVPIEMELLPMLRKVAPCVRNVSLLPFFLVAVVQIDEVQPTQRGIGKNIAMAALAHPWIKIVVVVDKDVNIYDVEDVLWAIATRVDFDRDILRVPDTFGFPLDEMKKSRDAPITRMGIDATVDPLVKSRFERARPNGYEQIRLKDYLEQE
ncbi:MAG: UbiD family decarboxylase [Deltaproteobacteria bacterium]|nr:UbiD family decarboxylase [Deltaproteobacteria bacterium]